MPYNRDRHHRHSIRLRGYDYRSPGVYFVTLCTHQRQNLFGVVRDGVMQPNDFGRVVAALWSRIPEHDPRIRLDAFQVMPNHVHGLIEIVGLDGQACSWTAPGSGDGSGPEHPRGPAPGSLGAVLGSFKSASTRRINAIRRVQGAPLWQRNYWEHIIRNADEYERIYTYVISNPALWADDELYTPDETDLSPQ